ncbi:PilZ domain-containing protein [Sphingobium sp. HBC34]|uniref:PilZ domain-containing protein n=1 Tax=Sphingobium cyanobacteriorum TaxID=3063954 RepID=A0ABT8ZH32_9SPHN|nr:PilZ domain-containing protein [Sphingobium sp. HBC34]MDO7833840.1 PilZ domain-containing protein [Sphingobium sp. HBC34]
MPDMTGPYRTQLHRFYRAARRQDVHRPSTLRADDGVPVDVLLEDVSITGCRIAGVPDMARGEAILIGLAGVGARLARVIWIEESRAGCHFDAPLSAEEFARTQQAGTVVSGAFPARTIQPAVAKAPPAPATEPRMSAHIRMKAILLATLLLAMLILIGA